MVALLAAIAAPAAAETAEPLAVPAPAADSAATAETIAVPATEAQLPTEATSAPAAPDEVSLPTGSESPAALADGAAPSTVLSSAQVGMGADSPTVSTTVERLSETVRRTSAVAAVEGVKGVTAPAVERVVAPALEGGKETLDSAAASATASPLAMATSPLGLDPPTSFEGPPNFISAGIPAPAVSKAGSGLGKGSAPTPLAAYPLRTHLDPIGATDLRSGFLSGDDRSHPSSPGGPPPPPFQAPSTVAGSGGSIFIPLAALLALLALAAPATFRRRREVPEFLAPVPFVCALERPG